MPVRNRGVAFQIVEEGGLLVTEYGTDFKSQMELSSRYKERDRLQALLCDTIVLAASYAQNSAEGWKIFGQKLDSGARLAMGYAKEYGIPRAVMYDEDIDGNNPMFDLNRDLISEQSDLTIITQENVGDTVSKILAKQRIAKSTTTFQQGNLFD
jgi:DNA processing protein